MALRRTEFSSPFPCFNYTAPISSIPHLNDFDVDLHVPSNSNFHYFTTHDFHDDFEIKQDAPYAAVHAESIMAFRSNAISYV